MLRYVQRYHEDVVASNEEPLFGVCYAPPLIAGETIHLETQILIKY
jgi:hypothetical protein